MKTRIFHTKFWNDSYTQSLTPTEKLLFIYYFTNSYVTQLFCYECTDKTVSNDTGINRGIIEKTKNKFQRDGKIAFYEGWVFLLNADKYENYQGEKNDIAKERLRGEMSKDVLDWYKGILDRGIDRGIDTPQVQVQDKSISINKGVVKGKKNYTSLNSLEEKEFKELAEKYKVPISFVISKYDDLVNYCESKGKRYKDYLATLRNWVKRDAIKIRKEVQYRESKRGIDARHIE